MTSADAVAVITDIHGNLPALQAALARIDELAIDAHLLRRRPRRLRPAPQRGLRAHRRARHPDHLRQLRLRHRPRPRRLRLRLHHPPRPRARPTLGRMDARAHRPGLQGLHARTAVRPALRRRRRPVHLVHGSPRKVNEYLFEDKPARLYERLAQRRATPRARVRAHPQAVGPRVRRRAVRQLRVGRQTQGRRPARRLRHPATGRRAASR